MKFMKRVLLAVLGGGVLIASSVMAQEAPTKPREEATKGAKPEGLPSREEIRKELEALPPEQREARLKEIRERMQRSPEMQKLREEIMALPPEQREARMKEIREKYGKGGGAPEAGKLREEMKELTPEQREARMKEMRERGGKGEGSEEFAKRREEFKNLSPEEREAKMKEMREQFAGKRKELEKKRADGTISPEEDRMLERIEAMGKRGEQGKEGAPRRPKAE